MIAVDQTTTTSLVSTTLKTTTFPCTVVGLRWNVAFVSNSAASDSLTSWAIVVVKDGLAANTPSQSNGADFYTPEQDVLSFGVVRTRDNDSGTGPAIMHIEGSTKTMRKLKQGDLLQFITICTVANGQLVDGVIQFFCKS